MDKFLKTFFCKKKIAVLFLILICTFIFLTNWQFNKVFTFVDQPLYELNPQQQLWDNLFVWHDYRSTGMVFSNYFGNYLSLFFKTSLNLIGLDIFQSNLVYHYFLLLLPALSIFYLSNAIFKKNKYFVEISIVASLFYQICIGNVILYKMPLFMRLWPNICFPFLFGSIINYLDDSSKKNLFIYLIATIMCTAAFTNPGFSSLFFGLFLGYIIFFYNDRKYYKKLAFIGIIFILITAPFIWGTLSFFTSNEVSASQFLREYTSSVSSLSLSNLDNSQLDNSFRFIGTSNWGAIAPWAGEFRYKQEYYEFFQSIFGILISFAPIIIFLILLIKVDITRFEKIIKLKIIYFLVLLVGCIFIIKSSADPFAEFFRYLIKNIFYFGIFRTPFDKIIFSLSVFFSLIFGFLIVNYLHNLQIKLLKGTKIIVAFILFLILIAYSYPVLSGGLYEKNGFISIDFDEMKSDYNVINNSPGEFRVIRLPNTSSLQLYDYNYFGPGLEIILNNNPIISYVFIGSDRYSEGITNAILGETRFMGNTFLSRADKNGIYYSSDKCDLNLNTNIANYWFYLLTITNTKFIIFDKHVLGTDGYKLNTCDILKNKILLSYFVNQGKLKLINSTDNFEIYELLIFNPKLYLGSNYADFYFSNYYFDGLNSYTSDSPQERLFNYNSSINPTFINPLDKNKIQYYFPISFKKSFDHYTRLKNTFGNAKFEMLGNIVDFNQNLTELKLGYTYFDTLYSSGNYTFFEEVSNLDDNGNVVVLNKIYADKNFINEFNATNKTKKYSFDLNAGKIRIDLNSNDLIHDLVLIKDFVEKIDVNNDKAKIIFQKINPTKYTIKIKNLRKSELFFLESYNSSWNLYPELILDDCSPVMKYNASEECERKNNLFEIADFKYLLQKPIFEDQHNLVNNYSNGWSLDSKHIKDTLSREYYKENLDGTVDINLILYYKPQAFSNLLVLISLITIVSCGLYLIYGFYLKR